MSEARALIAAAAAAALLAAGLPVQGPFPNPVENDAGSHADAPSRVGLPLDPGSYVGNVTDVLDNSDKYRLDPPPATVVRIRLAPAPENRHALFVDLRSTHGTDVSAVFESARNLSLVSGQGEPMTLGVKYLVTSEDPPPVTHEQRYLFDVTFERHDHAAELRTEGRDAAAWSVNVSGNGYARLEAAPVPDDGMGATPGDHDAYFQWRVLGDPSDRAFDETGCWSASGFAFSHLRGAQDELTGRPGPGDDPVWSHGLPADVPDQPDGPVPWEHWPDRPSASFITYRAEDPDGNLSMDLGIAYNKAFGHLAWVVWDGPADRAEIEERPAEVDFWTLEDFADGGGQAVGVGPYAQADNVTKVGELPTGGDVTRFVHVDATTPEALQLETGREETRVTVTAPNGSRTQLQDDHRHWTPLADDHSWKHHMASEAGPGEWRYRVDHSDGTEGDRIVVTQGSFEIPDECPNHDEMW